MKTLDQRSGVRGPQNTQKRPNNTQQIHKKPERQKALYENRLKKIRAPRGPCGAIFADQNRGCASLVPRENARREWPCTFSMTSAQRLAPPLQDSHGVRGRFKEGCFNRLRRCGRSTPGFLQPFTRIPFSEICLCLDIQDEDDTVQLQSL